MFALKIFKEKRKKHGQRLHFVAEVDVKNKRIFCRSCHSAVFSKKGALKYLTKLTLGKHVYRSLFLRKISECRPATLFETRPMHRFFSGKFLNFFGSFYSTPVKRCHWFHWILVNFDHHLRFTQMTENFDHHRWFFREYLKF